MNIDQTKSESQPNPSRISLGLHIPNAEYSDYLIETKCESDWKDRFGTIRVHKWKYFRTINLKINKRHSDIKELETYNSQLNKLFCHTQSLTLEFFHVRILQQEASNIIGFFLLSSSLTNLKDITLHLNPTDSITQMDESLLSAFFRALSKMQSVELNFTKCPDFKESALEIIAKYSRKYLARLKSLSLIFARREAITDAGLGLFVHGCFYRLTSLTSLNLNFSGCFKIGQEAFKILASEIGEHLTSLKQLKLNFTKCNLRDESIQALAFSIESSLTQLEELILNFQNCGSITEDTSKSFGNALKSRPTLRTVILDFKYSGWFTNTIKDIRTKELRFIPNMHVY